VRIPLRLLRTLLIRGTLAWLFTRALAAAILSLHATAVGETATPESVAGTLVTTIWVLAFSAVLLLVDFRRRKEMLLLRNLGLAPVMASFLALSLGLIAEGVWFALA